MSLTPEIILTIILIIVAVSYVFGEVLDYINLKAQRRDIPAAVVDFYDKEKYMKSLDYHKEQSQFSFFYSGFSFLLSFLLLWFGGFGWVDAQLRPFIDTEIVLALAFFGSIMIASDILSLPFQWYSTFVIEEKYGFNKTTVKTFVFDKVKGYLLGH